MKQIDRSEVIRMLVKNRLAENDDDEIFGLVQFHPSEEEKEKEIEKALFDGYAGVTNGFLSEVYEALTGRWVEVVGDVADLYPCPCCGLKTLTEIYDISEGTGYDICEYCGWEDVGVGDITQRVSINRGSIAEYRARIALNANKYYRKKWLEGGGDSGSTTEVG